MTKHFASSWLQSLSNKLQALEQWSWAADKRGACSIHRNLFREFFSAQFGKTLALVDEAKKTEFLVVIEKHLYKFDANTQQFPLMCLCALLQHGKDSPKTQEKIAAWVNFLLERLRRPSGPAGTGPSAQLSEVVEECLSAPFQRFVPLMEESLRGRLADGLGERLTELSEDVQKRVIDDLPAVPARVEELVVGCTKDLNAWLESAPRFPATPMALADTLSKMEHPLVRFFTAVKQPTRKEAFLVAVALALQGLRTRFRWMCAAEPDLEYLGGELQRKLFTVEGQGPVMEMWLSSRLKKYNTEVATRTAALVTGAVGERLRARLQSLFPTREPPSGEADASAAAGTDDGWMALDGPTSLADALLEWLGESSPGFFCPQHTLARETLTGVLLRFSLHFEVDTQRMRARLRLSGGTGALEVAPPPPPVLPPSSQAALVLAQSQTAVRPGGAASLGTPQAALPAPLAGSLPLVPGQPLPPPGAPPRPPGIGGPAIVPPPAPAVPVVVPPPLGGTAAALAIVPVGGGATAPTAAAGGSSSGSQLAMALQQLKAPGAPPAGQPASGGVEVDNLVDLLLNEALEGVAPDVRAQIFKAGHGVYRMGTKEVTLHTTNGRLYVYRVGEVVRHVPIQTLLKEEGLLPADQPAAGAVPAAAPGVAASGVAAAAAAAGTAGAAAALTSPAAAPGAAGTAAAAAAPVDSSAVARITLQSKQISIGVATAVRQDAQALMSKRVEAATKAMDVSKQIVRRSVNFDDEKLLRKLLKSGLKNDKAWLQAYQEYCTSRGIAEMEPKNQNKDFVASFIERNLANSIHEDWAKKIIYPATEPDGEKKEKKDKKDKKDKKKKDKKRKASDSSSSDVQLGGPSSPTGAGDAAAAGTLALAIPSPPGGGGGAGACGGSCGGCGSGGGCGGQPPPPGMRPPGMPPPGMPTHGPPPGMPMFGMPFGMGGMMGMPGGMMGHMPMFGDGGMPPGMGVGMTPGMPEERARKKAKKEDHGEKPKKEKGSKAKK